MMEVAVDHLDLGVLARSMMMGVITKFSVDKTSDDFL